MRVLYSGMEWFPECRDGGLNRYFYEQIQALHTLGVCGTALVSHSQDPGAGAVKVCSMSGAKASLVERLWGGHRVVRRWLKEDEGLINAHFALYAYFSLRDLPRRVPLVVHFHGPWAEEIAMETPGKLSAWKASVARRIERKVYRRADRVIALSAAFQNIVHRRYSVPIEHIRVIPGGSNLGPYLAAPEPARARERLGWPRDRPILVSVRRLARRMGLERLIAAIAEVRKACPDVLLLIGGRGAIATDLERQIHELSLAEHVKLLGYVPEADLPMVYAAADLTVVPTLALEGFGLITVESLASGTPVLGTPVGGTPEILTDLESSLVFADTSAAAMADRLISALAGRIPLPGRDECRTYAARYDWVEVAPRLLSVFREAAAAAGAESVIRHIS